MYAYAYAHVIVLTRGLIDDLPEATINLTLIGALCIFGSQYVFDKQ